MATNFAYRKRQLELEKKRKKEEKLKRKQEQKAAGVAPGLDDEGLAESDDATGGTDVEQTDAAAEAEQGAPSSEGKTTSQPER